MEQQRLIPDDTKVIAFDWDGTVVNSVPFKLAQNQALAHEFGNLLTIDEVRDIWNHSQGFTRLMKQLCRSDDMDAIMTVVQRDYYKPEYAKQRFEFAEPTLQTLRDLGYRTALVTSLSMSMLDEDEERLDFYSHEHFDYLQTEDMWDFKKPNPRVFEPLLEEMDIHPNQLLYVGDEIKDWLAATGCGASFVGVRTGLATAAELDALGIRNVRDISALLDDQLPKAA